MARDIVLTDRPKLDGDTLSAADSAQSLPVLEDADWALLYPLVERYRDFCPLLWRIWRHQQGAEADVLIERRQLQQLAGELAFLTSFGGEGETQMLGLLKALAEEAFDSGSHLAFVAD